MTDAERALLEWQETTRGTYSDMAMLCKDSFLAGYNAAVAITEQRCRAAAVEVCNKMEHGSHWFECVAKLQDDAIWHAAMAKVEGVERDG